MESIISEHIIKQRINSKRYYELHKELKRKSLEYYKEKYNNDPDFKEKRKEYMKEYQRKKREARDI